MSLMATHQLKFPAGDTHFQPADWDNYQVLQYNRACRAATKHRTSIDCGAHAGIMTRRMSRDFERVYSFEPVHAELLEYNTQDCSNVTIIASAVSDTPGKDTIQINPENSGDNVLGSGDLPVSVTTIDAISIDSVDFIKMDIQGHEYPALRGAEQTILRDKPVLMIEIEPDDPQRGPIENLLTAWGYSRIFNRNADHVYVHKG